MPVGGTTPRPLAAAASPVPDAIWDELESLLPPEGVWLDAPFDT